MSWLTVTIIVAGVGFMLNVAFGFQGWGLVAATFGFASWTAGVMVYALIVCIKSLRYENAVQKIDGQDKFIVKLKLGPFSYSIEVQKEA